MKNLISSVVSSIVFAGYIVILPVRAADELRFIPATPKNTTLVDGSPVKGTNRNGTPKGSAPKNPPPSPPTKA